MNRVRAGVAVVEVEGAEVERVVDVGGLSVVTGIRVMAIIQAAYTKEILTTLYDT